MKGVLGGNCNRTACQKPGATWFNTSTRKYYCAACAWRDGTHCSSPLAKFNGGVGLEVKFPQPTTAHFLCNPRSASGWYTTYPGPARSCAGREEIEVAATLSVDGDAVAPTGPLTLFGDDE